MADKEDGVGWRFISIVNEDAIANGQFVSFTICSNTKILIWVADFLWY